MKLRVSHDLCSGHGRCYTLVPDLLECDDEGFVTIRGGELEVPAGKEALAHKAVAACPEDAITLED